MLPRPPGIGVCDLMLSGLIREEDVLYGGRVDENKRILAEARYANMYQTTRTRILPHGPILHDKRPSSSSVVREIIHSFDDARSCCICREREKTHAPGPCFHMCMCVGCASKVNECPLCREPIQSLHRIYT